MKKTATAILIFAQHSSQEVARKSWKRGEKLSPRLIDNWNRRVCNMARSTGLPVLKSTDLIDHQGSFSRQINHAFEKAFSLGFERIICIGNDCPGLDSAILHKAHRALASGKNVLGPDRRGGVYLIGLDKHSWKGLKPHELSWQQSGLYEQLFSRLASSSAITELKALTDLHSGSNIIEAWRKGEINSRSALLWLSLLRGEEQNERFFRSRFLHHLLISVSEFHRGPPLHSLQF